jgi:hypothetical protein
MLLGMPPQLSQGLKPLARSAWRRVFHGRVLQGQEVLSVANPDPARAYASQALATHPSVSLQDPNDGRALSAAAA